MKQEKILSKLYDYQLDAIKATDENSKGIVCMPTGTGKTMVESAVIAKDIIENGSVFGIYLINAPRIILSYQLLKEVYTFLVGNGIDARYLSVHSGGLDDIRDLEQIRLDANYNEGTDIRFAEIESGTSPVLIREFTQRVKSENLPLIIFSTYNSSERINDAIPEEKIKIVMNDEAHYLVQEQFYDIIKILNYERCYFFTATTKITPSDKGRGMNNRDSYGDIIYTMTPREAIERGRMVRPRLHFVISKSGKSYTADDFESNLGKIIAESYTQHNYVIGTFAKPKMLVSVRGLGDIKIFFESVEYKRFIKSGVTIYAVGSDEQIGNDINGEKTSRREFLRRLAEDGKNNQKELIILHYDVLTEGINVPSITGILPLRSLAKAKFLQTFGRAARIDPEDRQLLETGKITPNCLDKMNKPYAWVIVPDIITGDSDNRENISNLIDELRDYGFRPSEDIVTTNPNNGLPTIEGPDALIEIKRKSPIVGQAIEKVEADYESERIAKLSKLELLKEKFGNIT